MAHVFVEVGVESAGYGDAEGARGGDCGEAEGALGGDVDDVGRIFFPAFAE